MGSRWQQTSAQTLAAELFHLAESLADELDRAEDAIDDLESENRFLKDQNDQLQSELRRHEEYLETEPGRTIVAEENEALREANENLHEKISLLIAEIRVLEAELAQAYADGEAF